MARPYYKRDHIFRVSIIQCCHHNIKYEIVILKLGEYGLVCKMFPSQSVWAIPCVYGPVNLICNQNL